MKCTKKVESGPVDVMAGLSSIRDSRIRYQLENAKNLRLVYEMVYNDTPILYKSDLKPVSATSDDEGLSLVYACNIIE